MYSIFNNHTGVSPVKQDFVWIGEYPDGTYLSEFDLETTQENSFYDLQRERLVRFGLMGHGSKLIVESDGVFNINGIGIEAIYRVGDKEYPLTGLADIHRDFITYKDAEAVVDLASGSGVAGHTITQYNFGYKTVIEVDDVKFQFQALCKIPFSQQMHMNFWLVANKKLDGVLVIKRNNRIAEEINAPLRKGVGGEVNYGLS